MSTYAVRSIIDPSRVAVYQDDRPSPSVLGLDAADHVLVRENGSEGHVLGFAPTLGVRPSFWRRAAIKAVSHILMNLLHPWARASLIDEHLEQNGRREVGGLSDGEHVLLVHGQRFEFFDDGHELVLRIRRGIKARQSVSGKGAQ